jgi:hypothetical protein
MLNQWRNIQKNKLEYYEEQYVSENNRKNLCLTKLMRFTRRRSLGLRQIAAVRLPRLRISKTLVATGRQHLSIAAEDRETIKH